MEIFGTYPENLQKFGVCGYTKAKTDEISLKAGWLSRQIPLGLKLKTLYSKETGTQGMIEYIPGQYCWRPVDAGGYLFIHCIFVGFKKEYKNLGWGSKLISLCENDAKANGFHGVAAVTRKSSFMADKALFVKNGFKVIEKCHPDFELLAKKFGNDAPDPSFKPHVGSVPARFSRGLFILRSGQCPYTLKNVREMTEAAISDYGITPEIIELETYRDAQQNPSPFGTFCIIHDGEVISHHPISKRRFGNILGERCRK